MRPLFIIVVFFVFFHGLHAQSSLVLKNHAQLRSANNPHSNVIFTIPKGTSVSIINLDETGYYKVSHKGRIGYINKIFFDVSGHESNIIRPSNSASSNYWNERELKLFWSKSGIDNYEGIYEQVVTPYERNNGFSGYKLAVKKVSLGYDMIYLGGAPKESLKYWKIGDIKANVIPTASSIYLLKWFNSDKTKDEMYLVFEEGLFKSIGSDYNLIFLKTFPSIEDKITVPKKREGKSTGSGFALTSDGLIVTNYHVIEDANNILVKNSIIPGAGFKATVLVSDKLNDLAIIKITDSSFKNFQTIPYVIKSNLSEVGERVYALGYPLISSMGNEIKLTDGIISSKTGFKGDVTTYQISTPIQPGNSGGPLFDSNGNLIGIISSKHTLADNASYAIKSSYLKNLIELLPNSPQLQNSNYLKGKTLSQQVNDIKNLVFIIETF